MNPFEVLGVVAGILGVWLTTRQKVWCWPIGIIGVLAYVVVFYEAKLYAAMSLQLIYVGLSFYGWYAWLHGGEGHGALRVSRANPRILAALVAAGVVVTALLGWWLDRRTDEALPYLDAFTTVFSLVAQWMQARKHLENWATWILVDVLYIGMSLSQGLTLTSGLYLVYIGLAVIGWRDWQRSMRTGAAA